MSRILELSIFNFVFFIFGVCFAQNPDVSFLSQAEDIEREAWWVVTNDRVEGAQSPFRVLRGAFIQSEKIQKIKINFKFCKKLSVNFQNAQYWKVLSSCQKPATEIGFLKKIASDPDKWKVSWKSSAFPEHFGLSTAILYSEQTCDIELGASGKIEKMICPHYVRDQSSSEIVDFSTFEYVAKNPSILKLAGEIKKDLQIISTFKSEVPLAGDIVMKVIKTNKTEFSHMRESVPKVPPTGEINGENESPKVPENTNEEQAPAITGPSR